MNVLDESISPYQRQLLRTWHVPVRHIGYDLGRKGMKDDEIIPFLLGLDRPSFFTLDFDFHRRSLCHARYCLVCLDVGQNEAAAFIRRLLRLPECNTQGKRMGMVMRIGQSGLSVWHAHADAETHLHWTA